MGALATSQVSLYPTVATGGINSSEIRHGFPANSLVTRRLHLALTGQGGQTNTMGAAALGFSTLISCSNLFDDTNNKIYPGVVDPVTNTVGLLDVATASAFVDVTSTDAYMTVTGYPLLVATTPT